MESPSQSNDDTDSCEQYDPRTQRLYVLSMLHVYREAAVANYAEAEELISRALDLREAGHAMLERAGQLAFQQGLDAAVPHTPVQEAEDDIAW